MTSVVAVATTSAARTNGRRFPVRSARLPKTRAPGTPTNDAVAKSTPSTNAPPPSSTTYKGTMSDAPPNATAASPHANSQLLPMASSRSGDG